MNFLSIKIENFLAIAEAEIQLESQGLVLVQGVNKSDTSATSNGAGKSSIFDALAWALYGKTARDETGDYVVNDVAKKNCMVEVTMRADGAVWFITRYRKHKHHKDQLRLEVEDSATMLREDRTKGTTALTEAEIIKLVGASHEVFCSAVYAGQEDMRDLPAMTDKQLKLIVEEASGITILEDAYKEAKARHTEAVKQLKDRQVKVDHLHMQISVHETKLTELGESSKAFEEQLQKEVADAKREADNLLRTYADNESKYRALEVDKLKARYNNLMAKQNGLAGEQTKLKDLEKKHRDAELVYLDAVQTHKRAAADLESVKKRLDNIEETIGQPCGECGKVYEAGDLESAVEHAKELIEKKTKTVDVLAKARDKSGIKVDECAEELDDYRDSMTDTSDLFRELSDAQNLISQAKMLAQTMKTTKQQIRDLQRKAYDRAAMVNPIAAAINDTLDRIEELKEFLKKEDASYKDEDVKVDVLQTAVDVLSPAGVRAHILDEITPYLNDQTAKYLSVLSDNSITASWNTLTTTAKGELREKFAIEVERVGPGARRFKGLSGGEKRKVRIATAMALQDLVARRATKPIDLFIGDEIDDALDPAGLERLMSILEDKAAERGSVFIISHNDLKDWISTQLTVTNEGRKATVELTA